jgi:hypothetical protein
MWTPGSKKVFWRSHYTKCLARKKAIPLFDKKGVLSMAILCLHPLAHLGCSAGAGATAPTATAFAIGRNYFYPSFLYPETQHIPHDLGRGVKMDGHVAQCRCVTGDKILFDFR